MSCGGAIQKEQGYGVLQWLWGIADAEASKLRLAVGCPGEINASEKDHSTPRSRKTCRVHPLSVIEASTPSRQPFLPTVIAFANHAIPQLMCAMETPFLQITYAP